MFPFIGRAYFPRTDLGQFAITVKAQSGTRLEVTDQIIGRVEEAVRAVIPKKDLKIIVSNIGLTPGFSAILNPNSAPHTAVVQVALNEGRRGQQFRIHGSGAARGYDEGCA